MGLAAERIDELCRAALAEARKSSPEDERPHPNVGAVLADRDGRMLLAAHRGERPKCHAEFVLLEKARAEGIALEDCVLFVTLEPCIKRGIDKIPCAVRVADSGIRTVFVGTLDPDPQITGRGMMYLQYAGVTIEHFPRVRSEEIRELNSEFFEKYRAAHFWSPPPRSLYGATAAPRSQKMPSLAKTREGLLHQTLDLITASEGAVWIAAGDLSWFREVQVGLLAARLSKRQVRILRTRHSTPTLAQDIDPSRLAASMGASVVQLRGANKTRLTLVGPSSDMAAAVFVEDGRSYVLRMPEDARMLGLVTEWFERSWSTQTPIHGQGPEIRQIERDDVIRALRVTVPQYKNATIYCAEVEIESLRPATHALESFKLFRIMQFEALRVRHGLPECSTIVGSPWPFISLPVVERLPDGTVVIIDGTHRAFSARARGISFIQAILVENKYYDLPSKPATGWDGVAILPEKLPREERYAQYDEKLFRPIRQAFESLAVL